MAGALYSKLDIITNTLQNWKIDAPLSQFLDKSESYFNKVNLWILKDHKRHYYANQIPNSIHIFLTDKKQLRIDQRRNRHTRTK